MASYRHTITLWKATALTIARDRMGARKAGWGGICRGDFPKSRISATPAFSREPRADNPVVSPARLFNAPASGILGVGFSGRSSAVRVSSRSVSYGRNPFTAMVGNRIVSSHLRETPARAVVRVHLGGLDATTPRLSQRHPQRFYRLLSYVVICCHMLPLCAWIKTG